MQQRYRTTHWQQVRSRVGEGETDFARHLREIARPTQIVFQKLMAMANGNPVGIECKSKSRDAWAFVMPNLAGDTDWKVQYFDQDGFSGHCCHATIVKAAEAMISEGYVETDVGALEKIAATERWALGVQRLVLREQFNQGLITWRELAAGCQALVESKD